MQSSPAVIQSSYELKIWRYVALGILGFSVLRGVRFPNLWAYTHFLFNYEAGFIKRGLVGEVFRRFGQPFWLSYDFFFLFSLVIFAAVLVLLGLSLSDLVRSGEPALIGCALVFAASLGVVFLAHTIGYFDLLGLLVALVALRIPGFYRKLLFLGPALPVVLLAHEAVLVLFFPVIFLTLLLSTASKDRGRQLLVLGLFSAAALALTLFVAGQTLTEPQVRALSASLQARSEFPLREDAFEVLVRGSGDNSQLMGQIWSHPPMLMELGQSFLVTAPSFLILIYFSAAILRQGGAQPYWRALAALAALSPLALHFAAWDLNRWNTLAVTTSFLVLSGVATSRFKTRPVPSVPGMLPIFAFLIFFGGAATLYLFDDFLVRQFPFIEHLTYLNHLAAGIEGFPQVPIR